MHNFSEKGVGNVVQQWYGVVKLVVMFSFPLFLKVRCVENYPFCVSHVHGLYQKAFDICLVKRWEISFWGNFIFLYLFLYLCQSYLAGPAGMSISPTKKYCANIGLGR